jgi:hypothetical protein
MKSILFVLKENIENLYRIKSITKYELKSDEIILTDDYCPVDTLIPQA